MHTNIDDDVQAQVQPTVGTIQIGSLQVPVPVRDRWPPNLRVYSRRQPHVQEEHQGSDMSSSDTVG